MRWIECDGGFSVGVKEWGGRIDLTTRPNRHPTLTPAEARELALELVAVAERLDPQPPPRPDRGPRVKQRR